MLYFVFGVVIIACGLLIAKKVFFGRETITIPVSDDTQLMKAVTQRGLPPVPPVRGPRHAAPEAPTEVIRRVW